MNRKILLSYIFAYCLLTGCASSAIEQPTPENPIIKDFDTVIINAPGEFEIIQAENESLEINGDTNLVFVIKTSVADGTLTISSEDELPTNASLTYKLFVKDLSSLTLNSFSVVKIPAYASSQLSLTVNGSGRMDLGDINVDDLQLTITGQGNISADSINSSSLSVISKDTGSVNIESGGTTDLTVEFGSGPFFGKDFKSTNAKVNLVGSGIVQVWAVETLDATINGTGSITYFGEPTLSMSVSGGGQLVGGGNK